MAESCEISLNVAERMIRRVCGLKEKLFKQIDMAYLSEEQKEQVKILVQERMDVFF